ncbi:MAG: hypothetical protein LIO76_09360 [Clostridiales bacterium]|nr:hypothetical protein [Clostridiales bacterium]
MKSLHRTGTGAFITAAGLMSALIISQGISCEKVSAQTQIVLPDPVAFFNAEEDEILDVPDGENFEYSSATGYDVMDAVEAYANLLISDYNFKTEVWEIDYDSISDPDPEDFMLIEVEITLAYDGDPEEGEIFIRYAHNNEERNIFAMGTADGVFSSYTLAETEPYVQGSAVFSLPDPDTVLGAEGKWVKDSAAVKYRLDADAETAASAYVSLLESDYGFQIINKEYDYESSEVADYVMTVDLAPEGDRTQGKVTVIASSISDDQDYIYIYVSNLSADVSLNWEEITGTNSEDGSASSQGEDGEDKSLNISDIRGLLGD